MHTSSIISFVSAAALMGSVGIAGAAQTQPPSPSSYQQSQTAQSPSMAMNGMNTGEQIASQAAAVLRNSTGTTQSSPSATGTTTTVGNGQIPQQFVNAAHCVVVFPNAYGTTALSGGTATGQSGSTTTGTASATTSTAGTTTSGTASVGASSTMGMREAGIASCRDDNGNWTAAKPAFVKLSLSGAAASSESDMSGNGMMSGDTNMSTDTGTGMQGHSNASTGLTGSQNMTATSDHALVLLFMDDDSADELKDGDITLGDDVDVASGPTGSSASDNTAPAAVLAYRGEPTGFVGADVKGAKVDFDDTINKQVYGQDVDPNDLLEGDYNGKMQTHLTAYNQALTQFAPSSQYNSKTSIAK